MSKQQQESNSRVQIIRGFPFPNIPWFSKKNIEDAMDYVPNDGDVIIASYPKTGTTWMQYIVMQIISKGEYFPAFEDITYKIMPYIEMTGIAAVEALETKPRIYKHHIAYNLVQKNLKSQCIYTYRNPEDTVVSFYHFSKNIQPEDSRLDSFDKFFDDFVSGNISYGNYFQHVLSFYEHREDENLLMVSYEKLQANRKEEILRIAKFLGEEYHQSLQEDEEVLNNIIEHTTFEYMKTNLYFTHPDHKHVSRGGESVEAPKVDFFRKGVVGDGKCTLTDDQRQRIRKGAQKILNGTTIINEWYSD